MLLVGAPALIDLPSLRIATALAISVVYLLVQNEYKPYMTVEHNFLAELGGAQITGTLLFISLFTAGMPVPRVLGFLCIVLNVILIPIAVYFNAKRLKRRNDILNAFLVKHEVEATRVARQRPAMVRQNAGLSLGEFFDHSHFSEYWRAGHRSSYEVFCATLEWIDAALERPVLLGRWRQILFTLQQLPLESSVVADVRHGACGSAAALSMRRRHRLASFQHLNCTTHRSHV